MQIDYDIIVVGGSLSGCFSALSAARAGARVILIESRTYLGSDFTATLRPWLPTKEVQRLDNEIKKIFFGDDKENNIYNIDNIKDEIPFYNGVFKKKLLSLLMNAGVTVLFASIAAGVVVSNDNEVVGITIANKSGLQMILGKIVIDATKNKIVAQLAGDNIKVLKGQYIARLTIEYYDVLPPKTSIYKVDSDIGLFNNKVSFHPGKKGDGHWFIEFSFKVNVDKGTYSEKMQWELEARHKTIMLCEYLREHCTYFSNAKLAQTSPEVFMPSIFSIEKNSYNNFRFGVESKKYKNLFIVNVQSCLPRESNENKLNQIYKDSQVFGKFMAEYTSTIENLLLAPNIHICFGEKSVAIKDLNPKYQADNSLKAIYYSVNIPKWNTFPIIDECNILVVGGGTSGAPAAIAAAREVEGVTLLESQYALGGTGTIGGINTYFFGNRVGFTAELDKKVEKMEIRLSAYKPSEDDNRNTKWNIEAKQMTYMTEILNNRGKILVGAIAISAITENNTVKGIIAATPDGIGVIKASIIIDATGDGDIAISAGADYFVGDPRGGNMQTFNQCEWKFEEILSGVNIDRGVIDIGDFIDSTRGIIIAHECAGEYDFSPYPSVRESRHVQGDYCFKMEDVLCQRKFKDTIMVGKTPFDQHGLQSSWFARLGYLPYHHKHFKVYMPYRACLPKGIDNILVIGKAFSATKDAFSFMRMQSELQNMGYAAGIAAALSFQNGITPRQLDVELLQKKLTEIGMLSMEDLQISKSTEIENMYLELINELAMGREEKLIEVLCSPREKVISLLETRYSCCCLEEGRFLLAMALTWFGSKIAIPELLRKLLKLKKEKQSSTLDSAMRPQGGYLTKPDVYWRVNQIIVLLGLSGDYGVLDTLRSIAEDINSGGPPNPHERIHWRRVPNYDRIVSLCFSFERLADRGSIKVLESLLDQPYLNGHVCKDIYCKDGNYASALLELIIARTLARCGGVRGGLILANYIDDVRKVLSDHAYNELKSITGQDFGKDSSLWIEWLNDNVLPVKPFVDTSDIIKG